MHMPYFINKDMPYISYIPWVVAAVGGAAVATKVCSRLLVRRKVEKLRHLKISQTRKGIQQLEERLQKLKFPDQRVAEICSLETTELLSRLQKGSIKPLEALHAFQIRTIEANKRTNCVTEFITEAEQWATELENQEPLGRLYGLPIAVKEDYGVKGYDCTIGCVRFIGQPFSDDAAIIKMLKLQGAVPFVKTNVPQTMLSYETSNKTFGTTVNLRDPTRGAGGSSGGVASLVASRGALLGVGTDVGGSIRCPAHMNGICGFKPTAERTSQVRTRPALPGSTAVQTSRGPLANEVSGLVEFMRVICSPEMFKLDVSLPPVVFDEQEYGDKRPLRIGYYTFNGGFPAVSSCVRAVHVARNALQQAGHTLVEFELPQPISQQLTIALAVKITGDNGVLFTSLLENDKDDIAGLGYFPFAMRLHYRVRQVVLWILDKLFGIDSGVFKRISLNGGIRFVDDHWKFNLANEERKRAFTDAWLNQELDAVLSPAFGVAPMPVGKFYTLLEAGGYLALYNILNYPAGVLPVTCVTEADKAAMKDYPTHTNYLKDAKESMKNIGALPVGVQVTTLPWKDELCLCIMKQLEDQIQFKPPPV